MMDRYDRIMADLIAKTEDGSLRWKVFNHRDLQGVLPVIDGVRRVFIAVYSLGNAGYRLFFVESRLKRIGDFGTVSEVPDYEIYIVNSNDEVAQILIDGLVERDDLLRLSGAIDAYNEQAQEFFDAFDRSGVA